MRYVLQFSNESSPEDWTNFKSLKSKADCYHCFKQHMNAPRVASTIEWKVGFFWLVSTGEKKVFYRIFDTKTQKELTYSESEKKKLSY